VPGLFEEHPATTSAMIRLRFPTRGIITIAIDQRKRKRIVRSV